jgi:hypothetical protein
VVCPSVWLQFTNVVCYCQEKYVKCLFIHVTGPVPSLVHQNSFSFAMSASRGCQQTTNLSCFYQIALVHYSNSPPCITCTQFPCNRAWTVKNHNAFSDHASSISSREKLQMTQSECRKWKELHQREVTDLLLKKNQLLLILQ